MAVQQGATELGGRRRAREAVLARGWKTAVGFCARKPLGAIGAMLIIIMVMLAATKPLITFYDYAEWNRPEALVSPSLAHWLGTDQYGRDMWTRIVMGAQISLMVGFGSVALGSIVGGTWGLAGAFYGGKVDALSQRMVDALMSIPTLVMALTIMAALGQSMFNVILAIGITQIPRASRIVRSQALAVKQSEYVLAARAMGATDMRIMALHIMPQCVAPWLIIATAGLGVAIISEASLSFLGLGVPPPAPSWGSMISGPARQFYNVAPWMAIWPGLAISLAVYGFNLFGDALRDVLDPRLRGT